MGSSAVEFFNKSSSALFHCFQVHMSQLNNIASYLTFFLTMEALTIETGSPEIPGK